jgi:UDP-N-acetylglucosamine diphosphorylase/glucosamine-1-phosphate N-acetyltransferase
MRNQIVILAAGKGTRLGGQVPKVLVMLKNKPLILYLMHELHYRQLIKPVVVVGFGAEKVKAVLGNDAVYAHQAEHKGTAHAVMCAKKQIHAENILVLYGDMPFIKADSLRELMRVHHKKESVLSMFTTRVPNFDGVYKSMEHYGRIIRSYNKKISKIIEFKDATPKEREIKELNPGIYMFNTEWLWENIKLIKNKNAQKEYYLTDIVEIAIKQGINIQSLEIPPKQVIGINSREDLDLVETLI